MIKQGWSRYWYPLLGLLSFIILTHITTLYINQTNSLSGKVFLCLRYIMPQRGDLVIFSHPLLKQTLTKRVLGVAGDRIHYKSGKLYVNETFIGPQYAQRTDGTPLTPIAAGIIPAAHYFIATPHARSFDSRYQEIGLISQDQIKGKGLALW